MRPLSSRACPRAESIIYARADRSLWCPRLKMAHARQHRRSPRRSVIWPIWLAVAQGTYTVAEETTFRVPVRFVLGGRALPSAGATHFVQLRRVSDSVHVSSQLHPGLHTVPATNCPRSSRSLPQLLIAFGSILQMPVLSLHAGAGSASFTAVAWRGTPRVAVPHHLRDSSVVITRRATWSRRR